MASPSSKETSPMEWNNHAVLLLELGRTQDARLLFEHALEALGVVEDRIVRRYVAAAPLQQESGTNCAPPIKAFVGWSKACFEMHDDGGNTGADSVFVYSRAVNIHPVFRDCFFELYAAAILFNLGLVHHIMALNKKDGSSPSCQDCYSDSSLRYDHAMNLLLRQQDSSTSVMAEKDALRTILFNNTGHIFYSVSMNSEAAIQCFTAVCGLIIDAGSSRVSTTINDGEQDNPASSLDARDVVNLLRNLLVFLPSNMAAASA